MHWARRRLGALFTSKKQGHHHLKCWSRLPQRDSWRQGKHTAKRRWKCTRQPCSCLQVCVYLQYSFAVVQRWRHVNNAVYERKIKSSYDNLTTFHRLRHYYNGHRTVGDGGRSCVCAYVYSYIQARQRTPAGQAGMIHWLCSNSTASFTFLISDLREVRKKHICGQKKNSGKVFAAF